MQTPPRVKSRPCAYILPTEEKKLLVNAYKYQDGGYDRSIDIKVCGVAGCIKPACDGASCIKTPTSSRKYNRDPTVSPVHFVMDTSA
jgi:hypothetical protein